MAELDTLALPVLPLTAGVVLPQTVVTLTLDSDEAKAAVAAADGADGRVLLVPRIDGRYARVGTVAHVEESGELPNGVYAAILRGLHRARLGAGVAGTGSGLWVEAHEVVDPAPTAADRGARPRAARRADRPRRAAPQPAAARAAALDDRSRGAGRRLRRVERPAVRAQARAAGGDRRRRRASSSR